jgi:type VI secretion system protein ImpF
MARLRLAVLRDVEELLNHTPLSQVLRAARAEGQPTLDLEDYPLASASVLDFGFPNMVGTSPGAQGLEDLRRRLKQALMDFEPRLDARSIRVDLVRGESAASRDEVVFRIQATLLGRPTPINLQLQTTLDLSTGRTEVEEAPVHEPGSVRA